MTETPTMTLVMPTMRAGQLAKSLPTFIETATHGYHALVVYNGLPVDDCPSCYHGWYIEKLVLPENVGPLGAMQAAYERLSRQEEPPDIMAYVHDDTLMREKGWDERVLAEFADPAVGVVGFGGALGLGTDDIYKRPYDYRQLTRQGYRSNTDDAEQHGERFTGACNVATLDGFALIVRKTVLDKVGGWPVNDLFFHCYDYWVTMVAQMQGFRVRLVGAQCYHQGGQSSVTPAHQDATVRVMGKTDAEVHIESHRFIYDLGQGVLPLRVRP